VDRGVPCGPIQSITDMLNDPQTRARDMVVNVAHTSAGEVATIGSPLKFSDTPASIRSAAPLLGEHTREVLTELGYDQARIDGLLASRVVYEERAGFD
jgi:crotonobetainyl-CoA:carnitine CoA-transferase CaiB-like acyl-CoA transferase